MVALVQAMSQKMKLRVRRNARSFKQNSHVLPSKSDTPVSYVPFFFNYNSKGSRVSIIAILRWGCEQSWEVAGFPRCFQCWNYGFFKFLGTELLSCQES